MQEDADAEMLLSEDAPVLMPELPATLTVRTAQQFKAVGDDTRSLILDLIKHQPLTAKQIGARLHIPSSTIGHHLQVLEAAGLARVAARRLVHGIVAKYYTRTARLFLFDFPPEVDPGAGSVLDFLTKAREQLADSLLAEKDQQAYKDTLVPEGERPFCRTAFPHARLSQERLREFEKRLDDLIYEFATGPSDPAGQVYALCSALFLAPPYLQSNNSSTIEE